MNGIGMGRAASEARKKGIEDQETRRNVKDDDLEIQNDQKSDILALDMGEGIAQIARNDTKLKPQNRTEWQQLPPKAQAKRLIFADALSR